ncbi:hypothetical protein Aspvir_004108 [Aspergillus viridinutans]|uniref:Uncharacterized protein n=1 Tax=Aspergillus viridinutans TaxID=75553 RepID=A0A9P3BT42_ASPVI|nr:uncharacterized protein Aspvir_004108 [Aspergillus viridinutans]GIK00093.1 hypothetical protein Aspvir_004108 [Aspergillus viridinutans]
MSAIEYRPKTEYIRRHGGNPRFARIKKARIWQMAAIYVTACRATKVTEREVKTVIVQEVAFRPEIRVDDAFYMDVMDSFRGLMAPFYAQRWVSRANVLVDVCLQVTTTGFSE